MNYKIGKQTIRFENPPSIIETAVIAGKKEGEGPLSEYFDYILEDDIWGEKSWEKAESKILKSTAELAIRKANLKESDIDYIFAGDLINQCIGANYAMKDFNIPFFGLYGACSTMTESLALGSVIIGGGFGEKVCDYMKENGYTSTLIKVGIPDEYVEHGNVDQLRKDIHMDADSIIDKIKKAL